MHDSASWVAERRIVREHRGLSALPRAPPSCSHRVSKFLFLGFRWGTVQLEQVWSMVHGRERCGAISAVVVRAPPSSGQSGAGADRSERRVPVRRHAPNHFPAPRFRTDSVRLPGRIGRLGELDACAVVVSAPPGYGKTTPLAESADDGRGPSLNVSLKNREDPAAFLLAASRSHRGSDRGGRRTGVGGCPTGGRQRLPDIHRACSARCALPLVLAIDDAELVASDQGTAIVDTLVDHLPDSSQLVLATRGRGRLHLGRLRANRGIFEVDAATLAFDAECSALSCSERPRDVRSHSRAELKKRSEGWPAGMSLATLAAGLESDPDRVGSASREVTDTSWSTCATSSCSRSRQDMGISPSDIGARPSLRAALR